MNKLFSKALFKENLKRFWSMSALALVVYYFSSVYIFQISDDAEYAYYLVNEMLSNQNAGFIYVEFMLPVFIAVSLFSYLNKANSVNLIHSLPLTRRQMYVTNYISGIVLYFVPQLITAVILCIVKEPTYYTNYYGMTFGDNIFTAIAIFKWLLMAFAVSLFVFSVSLFAVSVSGNVVIATLTAYALNLVIPVVALCIHCYAYILCSGYTNDDIFEFVFKTFHPAISFWYDSNITNIVLWIAIALVISVCAYLLYKIRKLERCSDAYVFHLVSDIFGFLFVFVCATIVSVLAGLEYPEDIIVPTVIGGLIGFILGQMITRKTFKIFDKKGFKNLIIYALVMIVIILGITLDIT